MIRILLVAEDRLWIDAVSATLSQHRDFSIVGKLTDTHRTTTAASASDVVIMHHDLQDPSAIQLVRAVRDECQDANIIVVGVPENPAVLVSYFEAGVVGYVRSDDPLDRLVSVIEESDRGETTVDRDIASVLVERLADLHRTLDEVTPNLPDNVNLTSREETVLELIAGGKTNQEISEALFIEVGTVKNHVHSILQKLNVGDRQQAAYYLTAREKHPGEGAESAAQHRPDSSATE